VTDSTIEGLRRRTVRQARPLAKYHDDPVAFVHDIIEWPEGQGPTEYQDEILARLHDRKRLAVRGPHGLGKTTDASLAVLWFALTRDDAGEDWKIPTTASAWVQLTHYLWPEIDKWAKRIRWAKTGREPFSERTEMLERTLKLRHGEAFSASPAKAALIEGAHATQLLYVYDEAKIIPIDIWDASEGAFSGAGADTAAEAFALAISTPGEPVGRFYDIHRDRKAYADWDAMHVPKERVIKAGRMSADWAKNRRRQWGATTAVYLNRVEGEFASSDEDSCIALAWVEAANLRWRERFGVHGETWTPPGPLETVGVDCSGTGKDRTVLARRYGDVVGELERPRKADAPPGEDAVGLEEMATAGRIVALLDGNPGSKAIVDAGGLGSGVLGAARQEIQPRSRVVAFVAGGKTSRKDANGEFGFVDCRSAAWWNMRELLDPESPAHLEIALPPDDDLTGDLTAPHWREVSGGKIRVEPKDDIRKRLGRSTDSGDGVVQAFWPESGPATFSAASGRLPRAVDVHRNRRSTLPRRRVV
jgi:hypothetical protein